MTVSFLYLHISVYSISDFIASSIVIYIIILHLIYTIAFIQLMVWSSGFIECSTGLRLREFRVLFIVWSSGFIDYSTGLGLGISLGLYGLGFS